MSFSAGRACIAVAALLGVSACHGVSSVPSTAPAEPSTRQSAPFSARTTPVDTTSILKKLTKDVLIGSTVDPGNGNKGPRGATFVNAGYGELKTGQVLVCNNENSAGDPGKGTTVEKLGPDPGKPVRFLQSTKIEGCTDLSLSPASDDLYVAAPDADLIAQISPKGKMLKSWSKQLKDPFSVVDGACVGGASKCGYAAEYVYAGDAETGGIVSFSVNYYGNKTPTEVASGFAVNHKTGWSALGPSGLAFNSSKKGTLYIADGVDNTVVYFFNATELLIPDEIEVLKGGKTFKCKYKNSTCGILVHAGAPLDAPVAMTLLPNGNLIVANTGGTSPNTLVEMTTTGTVLATKVVDKSKTAGIFGIRAVGTDDDNTALYYTDTNDNSLHKLEQ